MANPQQGLIPPDVPDAPFPAPPPFWKHFTSNNLEQLKGREADENFDAQELPYALAVLRPPPPPPAAYSVFNTTYTNPPEPTLPQPSELLFDPADLTRAGPSSNGRPHVHMLLLLLKSLLLNFLEFMTVMADDPVTWDAKMRDIGTILENFMAVINLLRPHQARESVKALLEKRLADSREEMRRCDEMKVKIEEFLQKVEEDGRFEKAERAEERAAGYTNGVNGNAALSADSKRRKKKEEEAVAEEIQKSRMIWEILDHLDAD